MLAPLLGKISKEEEKRAGQAIDSWPVSDLRELGLNTVLFFRFQVIFKHLPYKCPNAVAELFSFLPFLGLLLMEILNGKKIVKGANCPFVAP